MIKLLKRLLFLILIYFLIKYNPEPLIYYFRRDLRGIPVVCSPWTVGPEEDFDECMNAQREIDKEYGLVN